MRRLVLILGVALVASQAAGCIISSGDDDDTGDLGFIKADWDFSTAAGGTLNCPATFQTAKVEARGTENIDDLFDCDAFTGTSPDGHIIGNYDVKIIIADIDGAGNELDRYGESLTFDVDLVPGDVLVDETFIDDGGRFILTVDLTDGGAATTCAGGGVDAIGITATGTGANVFTDDIPCGDAEAGGAISTPALSDTYASVALQSLDAAGNPTGATATNIPNVTLGEPNDYQDLGTADVEIQ